MNKRKVYGRIIILLGVIFILVAVGIVGFNIYTQMEGEKQRGQVMEKLETKITENKDNPKPNETIVDDEERTVNDSVIIDGVAYIGYISIPSLDIKLPVSKDWNDGLLNVGACRYKGSSYQDDLVICAHNYFSYFAKIYKLASGDEVVFTDVYDESITYEVSNQEVIDGNDKDEMVKNVNDWDLTMFTCTFSGRTRQTVRCVRKINKSE